MTFRKSLWFVIGLVVFASTILSACGPSTYIIGSELICPLPFNPAVDLEKCKVAQSKNESYDATKYQKYQAVLLDDQHVAIYQKNSETYDILRGRGYFPVPNDYARIYPTTTQSVISNIDPDTACGGDDGIKCLSALDGVVMSGPTIFDSSYEFFYTLDFNDRSKYKDMYEAVTASGLVGFEAYMFTYNDTLRDVLRELNNIDPSPWLSGEKNKSDVEPIWLDLIANDTRLEKYRTTVKIDTSKFRCRYFDVPSAKETTSQGQADTEFQRHLNDLGTYCQDFQSGSACYIECMRVYECYASGGSCTFGGPVMSCGATVPPELTPTAETITTPNP